LGVVVLDDEPEPLPVVDDELLDPEVLPPDVVAVPVVPVDPVPGVEPGVELAPDDVPLGAPEGLPVVPDELLDEESDGVVEGDVLDDADDEAGGVGGVTTVVDELDDGGVVDVVDGGVSCFWQAASASRTLAATAVRIGRFIVAPGFMKRGSGGRTRPRVPGLAPLPASFSRIGAMDTRFRGCAAARALSRPSGNSFREG
jgi:hypothetical protein